MDFGTSIHHALEHHKTRKDPVDLSTARSLFESTFTKLHTENLSHYQERDRETPIEFFLDAGRNILDRFHECEELAGVEVVYNEYKIEQPIDTSDGSKLDFKGYVDMVIKTKDGRGNSVMYVCDFKTCSWGWSRDKREDKDLHFQILLYKHFLCKKFSLDPKHMRTAFVLLKKRPPAGQSPVEFFPISAGPVSVQRALDSLSSDAEKMISSVTTGVFEKNRQACVNEYGETCPYMSTDLCPND